MALTKYKLGSIIIPHTEKCGISNLTPYQISGVNREKEFFEPSHQVGEDTSKYQVVPPFFFACNLMHVGRDKVLPIAYNHSGKIKYVSPAYTVFSIRKGSNILSEYFYILLKSNERDRYFWFHADSSVRDGISWNDFCDIEIEFPDLAVQQKYVDIYNAMVANQQSYERGLDDLKLVCDGFIEDLENVSYNKIGNYIERNSYKNKTKILNKIQVKGFNNEGEFIQPMRLFSGDIATFKIIKKNCFVYNSRINSTIKKLSIALNEGEDVIVSPAYESFYIKNESELCPFYLYMLLQREKFAQKVLFNSFGSSTLVFGIDELSEVKIPVPDISLQLKIANLYRTYTNRKAINEKLKAQIKNICPILIRGSLEEARVTK